MKTLPVAALAAFGVALARPANADPTYSVSLDGTLVLNDLGTRGDGHGINCLGIAP
jgi:hypothetical protein